ncbi:MAG: hypothetical protein LBI18_10030 [Planctomycetaceae bacterium]|nr:hypothetical protein [Planctomycetaceae bacterium]
MRTIHYQLFTKKVGDVSPKHHVGVSRLAPVLSRLSPTQPFGERLPT